MLQLCKNPREHLHMQCYVSLETMQYMGIVCSERQMKTCLHTGRSHTREIPYMAFHGFWRAEVPSHLRAQPYRIGASDGEHTRQGISKARFLADTRSTQMQAMQMQFATYTVSRLRGSCLARMLVARHIQRMSLTCDVAYVPYTRRDVCHVANPVRRDGSPCVAHTIGSFQHVKGSRARCSGNSQTGCRCN